MDLAKIPRELNTHKLHLRSLTGADAEAMFAILSDSETMKYWSNQPVADLEEAVQILQKDLESDVTGTGSGYCIFI